MDTQDDQPTESSTSPPVLAEFRLKGRLCRIVDVSGIVPQQQVDRRCSRSRITYLPGELAHFDRDGHRLALVDVELADAAGPEGTAGSGSSARSPWSQLSQREREVVQLISMGLLSKQVADRLQISEFTVRSYLKTIYCKLGVRTRGGLVYQYAQSFGAPSPDALSLEA